MTTYREYSGTSDSVIMPMSSSEFKERIAAKLLQCGNIVTDDNLNLGEFFEGYYLRYSPNRSSCDDFIFYLNHDGSIDLHGNLQALIPTIKRYNSIEDFENDKEA